MEKYGVEIDSQKKALLQEEATLMARIGRLMGQSVKTASPSEMSAAERRLAEVRGVISQIDNQLAREVED